MYYFNRVLEVDESGYNLKRTGYFIYDTGGNLFDFCEDSLFLKGDNTYIEHQIMRLSTKGFDNFLKKSTGKAVKGIQ